jgi:hypothetical protein
VASRLAGHPLSSPYVSRRSGADQGGQAGGGAGSGGEGPNDPAWKPAPQASAAEMRRNALNIRREIPITTISTSWTVDLVRSALQALVIGLFDQPAQLVDALFTASRVQAAMNSRTGGLLGRPMDFIIPKAYRDSSEAKECADAFASSWEAIDGEGQIEQLDSWGITLGFAPAQLIWDFDREYATPLLTFWHPRYTYWHFLERRLIALGMDGQDPITPGDGSWVLHAPKGTYRGWMRSALRCIAEPWLARAYGRRDWARWSEKHGFPILKAKTPTDAEGPDYERFRMGLDELGQETVVEVPHGEAETDSYDLDYLETNGVGWESFESLIDSCDREITLAIMSQNLTTEVQEGSYAAARVHADVRQSLLEADATALTKTMYSQIARPFAAINFGNPDLAPRPTWDVKPYEDDQTAAQTLLAFCQALQALKQAGYEMKKPERAMRRYAIDLGGATIEEAAAPPAPSLPAKKPEPEK